VSGPIDPAIFNLDPGTFGTPFKSQPRDKRTCSTRHGFQTAITPDSVADLEGRMGVLTQHLEALASDLYSVGGLVCALACMRVRNCVCVPVLWLPFSHQRTVLLVG
jgi:hypothetical protein